MIARQLCTAVATLALIALAEPSWAQAADPVRDRITPIISSFMARLAKCGQTASFTPQLVIDNHPTIISYYSGDRSVHASRWVTLPVEVKGMMEQWAAQGTLGLTGEGQFGEVFNSLLVPHELGHLAADLNGRSKGQSFWDGEVYANRVAIAFWKGEPEAHGTLAARLENYNRFLDALPKPVPQGQAPKAWFEANYESLGSNPQAYGWYQGLFMREASRQAANDTFCELVAPAKGD